MNSIILCVQILACVLLSGALVLSIAVGIRLFFLLLEKLMGIERW